jgi:hypothetical protein
MGGEEMKRIDELSKAEILALTEEGKKALIELECALNGVPLLPEAPKKPDVPKYEPDMQIYKIDNVIFLSLDAANSVMEAYSKVALYKMGYDDKYPRPMAEDDYNYPKIKKEKVFSSELYNKIKSEKDAADTEIKAYEARKREYDNIVEKQKAHIAHVENIIDDVWSEKYAIDRYTAEFERYLSLADGNRSIAWNFLKNAHCEVGEVAGLFETLVPPEVKAE